MAKKPKNFRLFALLEGQAVLPWAWREGVQGMVYRCFEGTRTGDKIHASKFSLFTFAMAPEVPLVSEEGWESKNRLWWFRFASALPEAVLLVADALAAGKVDICGAEFRVRQVTKEPFALRTIFRAEPVLAAKLKEEGFWSPESVEFYSAVRKSLENRWEFCTGRPMPPAGFVFLGVPQKHLLEYRGRKLLAFSGDIRVEAPEDVKLFMQAVGLGQKLSCGFGMVW